MRKRAIERRRRVRGALRRKPAPGRIKSALRRRIDRSALELASGRPSVPPVVPALLAGSGLGALLTYFLDPRRGKGRRAKARDRAASVARRGLRKGGTQLRPVGSRATGTAERVARHEPFRKKEFDDAGLVTKVFGNRSIPKGALNVNVEKGVVIIRGEVERSDQIDKIERAVRRIKAVREVRNLLHTPLEVHTPSARLFIDYQNAYRGAREAFHQALDPHWDGQFVPLSLGEAIVEMSLAYERYLAEVRVYRGHPDATKDPRGYGACFRQCEVLGHLHPQFPDTGDVPAVPGSGRGQAWPGGPCSVSI